MTDFLMDVAGAIASSGLNDLATGWLRTVPGLPPILQTLHLLAVAVMMGTIVLMNLRGLGLAVPSQLPLEMRRRLLPWWYSALVMLPLSALPFFLARPHRYLLNPVFQIKMGLLLLALVFSVLFLRQFARSGASAWRLRLLALASLVLWLTLPLAGRWIAYSDYLFWPG